MVFNSIAELRRFEAEQFYKKKQKWNRDFTPIQSKNNRKLTEFLKLST